MTVKEFFDLCINDDVDPYSCDVFIKEGNQWVYAHCTNAHQYDDRKIVKFNPYVDSSHEISVEFYVEGEDMISW